MSTLLFIKMGEHMHKHHIDLIESAKAILSNLSSDELLDDFLELQGNACGPTVYEFFESISISTNEFYGFSNINLENDSYLEMFKLEMFKMDISDWAIPRILGFNEELDIESANDDIYHLHPKEIKKVQSFLTDDYDDYDDYALAS